MAQKRKRTADDWDNLKPAYRARMERTVGRERWIKYGPSATARGHVRDEIITKYNLSARIKGFDKLSDKEKLGMAKSYEKGFVGSGGLKGRPDDEVAEIIANRDFYLNTRMNLLGRDFLNVERQTYDEFRADYMLRFGK